MIIHHACSLHVSVGYSSAKEFEAPLFHVLADGIGYWGACRYFITVVVNGLSIGHKAVQVFIK